MRDVNAEFHAERMGQLATIKDRTAYLESQVAEGTMQKLSDGRYRVLTGWDRGEIFNVQGMPEHGLDQKENGETALYLKDAPAWHGVGTVIPGGSSSVNTVLKAAGLDWETVLVPEQWTWNGELRTEDEDAFVSVRSDNGNRLGTVGKLYTPVHNRQAFGFLDTLFGEHLMVAESAGSFRGGRRVFISAELPNDLVIDPDGINDHVRQFLTVINSHDGTTPLIAMVTPWRTVCKNTERLALNGAKTKWTIRHTKNWANRADEAKRTLGLTTSYYDQFVEEETALLNTPFAVNGIGDVDKLCDEIWGELDKDPSKKAVTQDTNRRERVQALWKMESERVGKNAYAAERAITGYVDHFTNLRPRGALKGNRLAALGQALLEESLDAPKNRTHKRLMELVKR